MIEVESCQSEQCEIVRGTGDDCTDIALCEPAVNCLAIPTCEIGEINVGTQACSERGESCRNVTTCGQTIHCWDYPKFCPQVVGTPPTCGAGFSEVGGCNTPQLNDGTCKLVSGTGDKCSTYIYCAAD